jgi:hypothetical protein
MSLEKYTHARHAVETLNRFRRPARRRKKEGKSHFERDYKTARTIWNDPNILGFGVGPKIPKDRGADFCVVFFVRKKLAKNRLRGLAEIPKLLTLNTRGLEVLTDVQEWGRPPVAHSTLNAGASIGDRLGNAGTVTLAVGDASSNAPLILSCSHVLAQCGVGANKGDVVESPVEPISPLGPNVVGHLSGFTFIDPRAPDNEVDAAVAQPAEGFDLCNNIPEIGTITGIRDLTQEDPNSVRHLEVQKFGAVTKLSKGGISNLHITTKIVYHQLTGDPSVPFIELVEYDCASKEGDSGAAVIDIGNSPKVVGMHIAGRPDGTSLFTHIRFVFEALRVNFLS